MAVPKQVLQLVETFDRNIEAYKKQQYNETQLRREFIDPFFCALGWDVANEQGYAQAYKDVIHEDAIKIGTATKAPDYSFRIGGTRKFFLEAKKPSIDIKGDPHPAYQLRRYAWSAKLPLSILTDFEEFAVYDCQTRPKQTDKAGTARIIYFNYKDYIGKWDEIVGTFSKDAVLKGSFDKFVKTTKGKRGTNTVDIEFLAEIEKWRTMLATTIALKNRALSRHEINFAVQRTIDRILFLRMCEDRGIESYSRLLALANGREIYRRLCRVFEQADDKYNSGLFHFRPEKGRAEAPDEITPNIVIDDIQLGWILRSLYFPQCPYEFSVLSAEILGNVYEQFLGKVIRLTSARQVKIEEKPEVKKAGGVYYTPTYIVDYIVKNTVGKLCEGKTPKDISKLKILDPACGSGSFLLGAYTYLLNYHRDWYVENNPEKYTKKIYQGRGGQWFLTIAEKKKILLNNIFGVDIDSQAVEVTKLSLLLKVLEGESQETLENQMQLFRERALPDLADNIKCGNSLIGPDFFDDLDPEQITDELRNKINPFDWKAEFPQIFSRKNPGFDTVIGNPPYIRIQALKSTQPEAVSHFSRKYESASKGNYDIYAVFAEKGLDLLNQSGRLGFILPHKFFNAQYGQPLRNLLVKGKNLSHVVHFGHQQVFIGSTTYTCLLFLENAAQKKCKVVKVKDLAEWRNTGKAIEGTISNDNLGGNEWNFVVGKGAKLFKKLSKVLLKLGDFADIFVGLQTSGDDVFIMDFIQETSEGLKLKSKALDNELILEKDLLFPLISGTDVNRYSTLPERQYILFPYKVEDTSIQLIDFDVISECYPKTAAYLIKNKKKLEQREKGKVKGPRWYGYIYLKNMARQSHVKLCVPRLVENLYAAYDDKGTHFLDNVDVGGITLKAEHVQHELNYLLGLLNSKLLQWYFPFVSAPFRGGWLSANRQFLSQLPIRTIDFDNPDDKAKHATMVKLVNRMLDLHKKLAKAKVPADKTRIQRQITTTDKQIDKLVYQLYNLTPDEIKIIEQST
ncbi:MAG: Eco57I restriction-modification methylase domain-containing protein [Planctomycetota bacterium]|jgi:type I restriction-modification system DNA methylase subunit